VGVITNDLQYTSADLGTVKLSFLKTLLTGKTADTRTYANVIFGSMNF
jgi:hypothetical protein